MGELGLRDFEPSNENVAVKSFKESFAASGRLDAEFYQPKYDALFNQLKKVETRTGWRLEMLGNLSEPLRYGSSEKLEYLENGVPFLRIADVRQYRFDPQTLKYISKEAAKDERQASVETNDVVISRSGTLGLSIAIPSELAGAIFGSYFIRVRPKADLNPQFLALYMNGKVGQIQVEQANTGGIQTNLTIPVMEAFRIALPPKEIQDEIVRKVYESFQTQDESKHLLDAAKRGVELAIEQDEQTAFDYFGQSINFKPRVLNGDCFFNLNEI